MMLNIPVQKDIRRGILWLLKAVQRKINDKIIRDSIRESGHDLSAGEVRDHLRYLAAEDKGYITLRYNRAGDIYIAEITGKGRDLIDGIIYDPGVTLDAEGGE